MPATSCCPGQLRATKENKAKYEGMKADLEVRNVEMRGEAQKIGGGLDGKSFVVLRQASEVGQLYGSVSGRDVAALLNEAGFKDVTRGHIALNAPIKTIGLHKVPIALHPEVEVAVTINVARSAEEAERIARGEDVGWHGARRPTTRTRSRLRRFSTSRRTPARRPRRRRPPARPSRPMRTPATPPRASPPESRASRATPPRTESFGGSVCDD